MNPYSINPPESEVEFEKLCLALLKRHWSRPGLERFAKKGEQQFGVDIFDTRGESPLYAAQCKLKEQSKSLEPKEIREEVNKAKSFPSKLDHYAILTTGKVSGAAQVAIQAINQEHRAARLFIVELFTWGKITEMIRQYPQVEGRFYGGLRSEEVATVNSKLDYITKQTESVTATSKTTEIDALIDEARTHITPSNAQIAVLLLNRIQRTKGGELTDWHRFRILTNLGAASLTLGKGSEAARYFLNAKPFRPDDELAVANEVLGYHLLLQQEETQKRSEAAVGRFPNSCRLRALWIQSAPQDKTYEKALEATPAFMRKDAEVASALSRRAAASGLIDRAIKHAKDAVTDKPEWSQAHLLLAQAYLARVAMAERTVSPLKAEDTEKTLTRSVAAADDAISLAETDGTSYVKAEALALKSAIALLQGRKEEAVRFARESFGADSREPHGRIAMAQAAFSVGNADDAIRILEEAYSRADPAANVSYMLGQALMERGTEDDVNRAIDVFSNANTAHLDRELIDPIIIGTIRALVRAKRFAEVPNCLTRPDVAVSATLVATIKAYVALKQFLNREAGNFLDAAIASWNPTDTRSLTEFLARTLMEAGRLSDALPLLQELFNSQTPNFDVGLLLNCASRLKQDKVILDTCQVIHERGEHRWEFIEFESQYLEEYDFPKAINRLQEFIAANPKHRVAKLRLAVLGIRCGQYDLVKVSGEILPPPEELPMRYAVAVIQLLQWHSQRTLAVDYAYRVLRAHFSELEAHKAYLASVMPAARPEDIPGAMDKVEIGSAVQYSEVPGGAGGWFVIEGTDDPSSDFEELSARSVIARELLGKKVGDSFILAKGQVQDRVGKVVQILSKYARRFQVIGEQMQLKFGGESVIQTLHVPPPEKLTAADLQPILDSVKARSEAVSKLREAYRSTPVTLHMYGKQLGYTAYQALMDLAASKADSIRCAPPQRQVLATTLAILRSKGTVVLDLSALATLHLLGTTRRVLTTTGFRFVISPATFAELQALRGQSRLSQTGGMMFYEKGQHYFARTTKEHGEKQKAAFEEMMECIEKNVNVVPVPELATLMPEKREPLEKILGQYGLESALLALSPGCIWWADDFVAGEVTKSELGVEHVWTQAIIEHLASLGLIDRGVSEEAYAKLVGFNYDATHFTAGVMIAALRLSEGSVDTFPMCQTIQAFKPLPSTNRNTAFRLLAEFILRLTVEPLLPETKCVAIKALLNAFPGDTETAEQLKSFRVQCARLMTINPPAQADFIKCFDQWDKEKLTLKYIVRP